MENILLLASRPASAAPSLLTFYFLPYQSTPLLGSVYFRWQTTEVAQSAKGASGVLPLMCLDTGAKRSQYSLLRSNVGSPAIRFP